MLSSCYGCADTFLFSHRHELLQSFSLHLFAKRPVEAITDLESFRRSLARRIALAALQIRLNVGGRSDDPAFTFVEFNQLDSAREGCAVCSLDMTAEPDRWQDAICKSLSEIRKLGLYGVTPGEMERYASSLMTDAEQLAAQGDRISHGDQLSYLMETVANGHTFMSPMQSYYMTAKALQSLTLEEVNKAASDLCSHITGFKEGLDGADGVCIAIACSPKTSDTTGPTYCDEESLVKCIYDACQADVEPEEDVVVPHTLISDAEIEKAMTVNAPEWKPGHFTDGTPDTSPDSLTRPFTLRRLGNGIRVGVAQNSAESQVRLQCHEYIVLSSCIRPSHAYDYFISFCLLAWASTTCRTWWSRRGEASWIQEGSHGDWRSNDARGRCLWTMDS